MNKKLVGFLIILFSCTLFVRTAVFFLPKINSVAAQTVHGRIEIMAILSMVYMIALLLGFIGMIVAIKAGNWPKYQEVEASRGHILDQLTAIPTILGLPFLGSIIWSLNRKNASKSDQMAFIKALDFQFSMTLFLIPALLMINFGIGALLLPFILVYWLFFVLLNALRIGFDKIPWYSGGFGIINRPPKGKKSTSKH